jgi:hypothetical protein
MALVDSDVAAEDVVVAGSLGQRKPLQERGGVDTT